MKTLLISTILSLSIFLSGCKNFDMGSLKPLVNATVLVAANKYAQKDPCNVGKILDLATALEVAASAADNTLTKQNFVDMVSRVDVEWGVLGVALYDVYAQNVTVPEKYSRHAAVLRELATTLRDSILFVTPQK